MQSRSPLLTALLGGWPAGLAQLSVVGALTEGSGLRLLERRGGGELSRAVLAGRALRMTAALERDSASPEATELLGSALGAVLRAGDVLVLEGQLGAGKTCLVRGIVAGAGGDPASVRSPTFVLHQPHPGTSVVVHHVDLYRLGPGASVDVLDLDLLLRDGAAVIEWGGYADLSDSPSDDDHHRRQWRATPSAGCAWSPGRPNTWKAPG